MDNTSVENMGQVLAIIVTVSLALMQAVGPLVMYITEAIKATGKVKDGWSGLVALIVGIAIGAGLGGLTDALAAESYDRWALVGVGAFAGALMAAGAIKTYKAVGEVNTKATPTVVLTHEVTGPDPNELEPDASQPALSQSDFDAMNTALEGYGPLAEPVDHVTPAPPLPDAPTPIVVTAEDSRK